MASVGLELTRALSPKDLMHLVHLVPYYFILFVEKNSKEETQEEKVHNARGLSVNPSAARRQDPATEQEIDPCLPHKPPHHKHTALQQHIPLD